MAKGKGILTFLNFGIVPGHCMFVCGMDEKQALKRFRKEYLSCDDSDVWDKSLSNIIEDESVTTNFYACDATFVKDGRNHRTYFIFFKEEWGGTDGSYVILAHEVLHVVQFFSAHVFDRTKEIEFEAYLHTHLMSQCLDAIQESKKKKNGTTKSKGKARG
jgi:hypothetical protein